MNEEKAYTMPWGRYKHVELKTIKKLYPDYFEWLISPHNDFVHPRNVLYHELKKISIA